MSAPERVLVLGGAAWVTESARAIGDAVRDAVGRNGSCSLALAGGSTPRPVYERLGSSRDLPWGSVHVYFGDERCVAPDDPASNYRMASETILRAPIAAEHVHRMRGEDGDADAAAQAYEKVLPPTLDVLLLGVGEDGHCASLFPGSAALGEHGRRVVAVDAPGGRGRRLTITPPVIERAGAVLLLASGESKAEAVRLALEVDGGIEDLPARLARPGTWLLDEGAASALGKGGTSALGKGG